MSKGRLYDSRTERLGPEPKRPVRRIVSLVPSLTDAVFEVGAGGMLIGRTEWCVRPRGQVEAVETIGGTKDPDLERIVEMAPDVILASKEENTRDVIIRLAEAHPIWLTDARSPRDVPALWHEMGEIVGRPAEGQRRAENVVRAIHAAEIYAAARGRPGPRFRCYVWKDPWRAVGHDTYISNLLETVGLRNALAAHRTRYPTLNDADLSFPEVDAHLFTTEPYRFVLPRDLGPLQGTDAVTRLVDGQLLSWYPSLTESGLLYALELREKLEQSEP